MLTTRSLSYVTVGCFATLLVAGILRAQQRGSAGIYGSVVDTQGAAIAGARVTAVHVATNQVRTVPANTEGQFLFAVLPVGEYRVSVVQPGFKKYEQTGIVLQVCCKLTTACAWTSSSRSAM
jgi:hypothetical protein